MSVFSRLRLYHAAVGLLAVASYLTEDVKNLHVWIGYILAVVLALRLGLSIIAPRALTKPHWLIDKRDLSLEKQLNSPIIGKSILIAITACLFVTIGTGVAMDQKLRLTDDTGAHASAAYAEEKRSNRKRNKPDKVIKEIHETSANLLFLFVFLHVSYLLLVRRQYALSMVFMGSFARRS